jgi:hypothetical protein
MCWLLIQMIISFFQSFMMTITTAAASADGQGQDLFYFSSPATYILLLTA